MLRPVLGSVVCFGRTCLQSNSSRFLQCQASFQYYPRRNLIAATRLLLSSASNSVKYNKGLLRQTMQRRCSGTGPSAGSTGSGSASSNTPASKLSLFARFKAMYKDYWYVMLPVHLATSACWFGAFYYVSATGIDIRYYLRQLGVSETIIKHITESLLGDVAVAWAIYKVATPARYAVTLGGTTVAINVLRNMGYIKPAKELMAKGRTKIQSIKDKQLPKK